MTICSPEAGLIREFLFVLRFYDLKIKLLSHSYANITYEYEWDNNFIFSCMYSGRDVYLRKAIDDLVKKT